ncbi:MAG: hypothetical protein H0V82_00075 [Candidatus Protochlamydia sp.]|nr:hypothetical protein [Candidatus Protochlamydia sp.]
MEMAGYANCTVISATLKNHFIANNLAKSSVSFLVLILFESAIEKALSLLLGTFNDRSARWT